MYLDLSLVGMILQIIITASVVGGAVIYSLRSKIKALFSKKRSSAEAGAETEAEAAEEADAWAETEKDSGDAARFSAAKKQLVFYALSGGQYKFYKEIIEYILEHSDIEIHYLTNEPDDAVLKSENGRLIPYYASRNKTISLMLKLDCEIMATTVPDLQSYYIKRSLVRNDIEYIHIPHGLGSEHMVVKESAYDYFDTIFCVGPHRIAELRRREEMANLPRKNLVKAGYGLYDQLAEAYAPIAHITNDKPKVLIAPSWQDKNILELCIDDVLNVLLGKGFNITVRPHLQFTKMFPEQIKALTERFSEYVTNGELFFETDFAENNSIFMSDVVITDWSTIAYEFSYVTMKPCIFINTPMKVLNPNYEQYGLEVLDITLRDKVGVSVELDEVVNLENIVTKVLGEKSAYKDRIKQTMEKYLYNPGRSGEVGGKYIISRLVR